MANGLGPRTQIVSATLDAAAYAVAVKELGDRFVIAGVDGTLGGTIIFALQGTHDFATGEFTGTWATLADFSDDSFATS